MVKKKAVISKGSTVTGTDADLRRLSMEAAREVRGIYFRKSFFSSQILINIELDCLSGSYNFRKMSLSITVLSYFLHKPFYMFFLLSLGDAHTVVKCERWSF